MANRGPPWRLIGIVFTVITVGAVGASFLFFILISFKQGNMIGSVEFFMYAILLARLSRALTQPRSAVATAPGAAVIPMPLYPNMMR